MKKIITAGLVAVMAIAMMTGCGAKEEPQEVSQIVNVATLNGPTGMSMVSLMDMEEKYAVTTYQAPTDITAKIINGEVDVAAVPSNLAAVLYNKTGGEIVVVSPTVLGMLQILGNDVEVKTPADLKGKTIVASGQGGTPEYVLTKILEDNGLKIYEDVNVEWLPNHSEVNAKLANQAGTIAMIPEPFVSTALSTDEKNITVLFVLIELWKEATGEALPMGVLIAKKSFAEERRQDLEIFLNDLQDSTDYVNESPDEAAVDIVEKGFIGKVEIAKKAIPNCHIVLYTWDKAQEGISILKTFNQTLFDLDPASIGGKIPDEDLYYR